MLDLDHVVQLRCAYEQRASYAAVAGCTGGTAQRVMGDRPRNHLNSWVVAKKNGCPTGYQHTEIHPACRDQIRENWKNFISCPKKLRNWLTAIMQSRNGVQV